MAEQCNHCLHDVIKGVEIGPGEQVCCMCRAKVLLMPILWQGDNV